MTIDARLAAGNPPEVIERVQKTHAAFVNFKRWLAKRDSKASQNGAEPAAGAQPFPTFREWFDEQSWETAQGS